MEPEPAVAERLFLLPALRVPADRLQSIADNERGLWTPEESAAARRLLEERK
jgi:hypothetical protein